MPFSEERTNTLENEITKPLAERADAMQDYGNQWEDSRKEAVSTSDQAESNLINLETQAELANKTRISSGSHTKELSQYYAKVKTYINANTINEKTSNLKLELTSATELGSIEVIITSTGASCLQVNGKNLCNGAKRTKRFNPKTTPQQLDVTSADKKAGVSLLQIQMCIPGTTDCVTKNQRITIQPGPRDHFNIQPQSTFTPRGMVTPITITARDANNNPIDRTNDQFTIQVNEGLFLHDGSYKSSFTADRFKNLTVLYQAPQTGTATTATIEILSSPKLTPNGVSTGTLQLKATQQIIDATPLVKLNGTNIITTLGGSGNKTIQLNNTGNNTPQKIELFIRNSQGQNINIDTSVSIKTNNGLLNIGTLEGKKFKKRSTHTLSEGQLTFYYYPTNTAGKELLTIQIPGLAPLTINFDIKPAIAQVVEMQINQENLNISTTTTGTIQIKDVRGNLVPTSTAVKFTSTQNLTTTPNNNVIVSSGQMTFTTTAKEAGVGYLIGEIITNAKTQTKPGTIRVHITDNLIPTTGLNILYLNYFGNDRGNQRGYFSDNNKYIETMMKNSNKLLATTTQLVDESKIKKLLRAVDSNFQIKTYEGIATTLNLSGNQIHLNMGNIGSLTTTLDPITRITISETEEYQKITESKKI
ncbi:MAG: hypothetical protein LBG52_03475 [Candidatus Peribacteria bacterium]|nr:hypothetical protein [Candidatus Peribacteria bacterium]